MHYTDKNPPPEKEELDFFKMFGQFLLDGGVDPMIVTDMVKEWKKGRRMKEKKEAD